MGKILLLVVAGFALPAFAQEHYKLSIPFGSKGVYSDARTHVYIDKEQYEPHCPCYRFSFLVDDRDIFEVPPIERVLVWLTEVDGREVMYSPKVLNLTSIARHPMSPRKSVQVIYRLERSSAGTLASMKANFVAMRRACSDAQNPECSKYVIDTQGDFDSDQLGELKPVKTSDLLEIE